jgi:hypothetical protein
LKRVKQISIEGHEKEFVVNELGVNQVLQLLQRDDLMGDLSINNLEKTLVGLLPEFSNITIADLKKMAPSEIRQLWEGFKEVNSDFFEVSRALGVSGLLETLKEAILSDFSKLLVSWLKPGMSEFLTTDTPSSDTP